jgi:hypothetical protein
LYQLTIKWLHIWWSLLDSFKLKESTHSMLSMHDFFYKHVNAWYLRETFLLYKIQPDLISSFDCVYSTLCWYFNCNIWYFFLLDCPCRFYIWNFPTMSR